jgi:SAM-dependent methyltransferase
MTPHLQENADAGHSPFDLDELSGANRLADWMFEQFRPAVGANVVEVGPGVGTFTERLLGEDVKRLLLIEADPRLAGLLEERYDDDPRVTVVTETLPASPTLAAAVGQYDFVLCQNVLEHIEDDAGAAAAMAAALRPGGRLGILVPAHPRLYGAMDTHFGHHRRYTRERLRSVVTAAGIELTDLYSFNLLGVLGWWARKRSGATQLGARSRARDERIVVLLRPRERHRPLYVTSRVVTRRPRD